MSAMSFLSNILGVKKEDPWYAPPKDNADMPYPAQAQREHVEEQVVPDAILLREEMLDARSRLCGYRFMPRALAEHRAYPEPLFFDALREDRVVDFAQRRIAVVPITPDALVFGRHHAIKAPNIHFLLDARHTSMPREDLLGRLAALRDGGHRTALAGVPLSQETGPLLALADMVFFDLAEQPLPGLQAMLRGLRAAFPKLAPVATGVHSWAEQRMCVSWGFEYSLGDFLSTKDDDAEDGELSESQLASMEMLNLLRRDAELPELVAIAKRDPGLTFHLLKWANAPATGLAHGVTSVSQAIMVLGRGQMYRWLTVAMFRMGRHRERDESLLELALTRARTLETLDASLSPAERDELFLVGLLSLFDILLHMPMQKVLAQMPLSDNVCDVLLRSMGPYGSYLMLVMAMEKGRAQQVADLSARLGIAPATLEPIRSAAFNWAQEALGATVAH